MRENASKPASVMERILAIVAVVRPDETGSALLMTLNGFLLVMAYSAIKPVREALLLAHPGGAEYQVYMSGATAIVLTAAVPLYSRLSRNLPRDRLIIGVTLFFASHLVLFYGLGKTVGASLPLGLSFYLWIAVFNMMIVAQFWAFANDLYVEESGERLFPLFGLGASLGAVAGSGIAKGLLPRVGVLQMMPIAAALLVGSAVITSWVHRREVRRAGTIAARETAAGPIGGSTGDAFRMLFAHRYLLLIAAFSLVFTLVKTNGDYVINRIVQSSAAQAVAAGTIQSGNAGAYIANFYATYEFRIDVLSLLIQAFLVSRLVKYLGVTRAFFIMPLIALGDAVIMVAFPFLAAVRIGKTAESATDYSLNNTLRGMLWLPTSRRAKYLVKQAADTFFVRLGDVSSAVLVFVAISMLGLSLRTFAAVNVVLVGVWLILARDITKERARLSAEPEVDEEGTDTVPATISP